MGKIDEYIEEIEKRIDKSVGDLEAIKNYQQVSDKLTLLEQSNATLQSNYNVVLENVATFKETNKGLQDYTEKLVREYEVKLMEKEKEITKLKQALDFRRAIRSDPDAKEPGKG